ncbi:hypothetical protein AMAG_13257 [Allomyces macrogynus ATCC 38327]|uniref:Centrosomal protein of 44 kDa n=1 Tax=Allomyces macrogynus (strain ATCC 38327) TaxID=578462 RepID=A0A0L0SZX7_ALLM3|nr:hypothetical protein AMAG_13257 [Allomyces macrogynus ATCC 38327]|eukprot:KNE68088.1 hypothetical protein AMAG_13257 [Allomyces macrogynus ATCC 38327]
MCLTWTNGQTFSCFSVLTCASQISTSSTTTSSIAHHPSSARDLAHNTRPIRADQFEPTATKSTMQVGSTGDIRNLLMRLYRDLRAIKYPGRPEPADLCAGLSAVYLPIIHYVLLDAFPRVAQDLVGNNQYTMHGKRDRRFLDAVYRVLRDLFAYKPALTRDQFFHHGFAARKLLFLLDMIELVRNRARDLDRLAKLHAPVSAATVTAVTSTSARSGTGARSSSSSAPSMTHLAHQIEAATAAAAEACRDDISYTLPVPAQSAPAPSSPPRRGAHVSSSSSEDDENEDERDDEDHVAARHRVDPLFATVDELREMDAAAPRPDGDGMRWSDLHKVLAYVQASLTTLEATLRVMQGRLDAVEGAQASAKERAKAAEAERERLVAQNEALKLENESLAKEVATLKMAMQRREPVFSALGARQPPPPATAAASTTAPPPNRPLFSFASPPPPAPARSVAPARPTAPASTAPTRPTGPAPAASVQSQLNDAKAIRDAIAHRLQSTQALMQGLQRLSSATTSPVK